MNAEWPTARLQMEDQPRPPGYRHRSSMDTCEMQFPLKAVMIAVSLFWSGSVSSQDLFKSATSDEHDRLNRSLPHELDGVKILVLSAVKGTHASSRKSQFGMLSKQKGPRSRLFVTS